ncbi:MAG: hypothetical protein RIQ46_1764 [Pseudomonadota bacterium]|jgi:hypothetical protein
MPKLDGSNRIAMKHITMIVRASLLLAPALLLSGCVGRIVTGVVTAPVKVAGKVAGAAVDLATTSDEEKADRQRKD